MSGLSRRRFITGSSLTVAAAGLAGSLPALPAAITAAESDAPEANDAITDADSLAGPLVAHVTDLQRGEISLYAGEREVVLRDPALAARLFRAAR